LFFSKIRAVKQVSIPVVERLTTPSWSLQSVFLDVSQNSLLCILREKKFSLPEKNGHAATFSLASAASRAVFMALTVMWLAQARRSGRRKR
jgi:hypothetical protein